LLWAVQTLDRKWLLLQKRKVALQLYYEKRFDDEKRRIDDVTRQELNSQLYNSIIEALKDAKSEKEVEDVDAKFNLHFPPGEVEEEGQFKRPKRKSLYSICHKAGLWEVANQFGRSAEQLGHHLTLTKIPVCALSLHFTFFFLELRTVPHVQPTHFLHIFSCHRKLFCIENDFMIDTSHAHVSYRKQASLRAVDILLKRLLQISHVQCLKHHKMFFGARDTWYLIDPTILTLFCTPSVPNYKTFWLF